VFLKAFLVARQDVLKDRLPASHGEAKYRLGVTSSGLIERLDPIGTIEQDERLLCAVEDGLQVPLRLAKGFLSVYALRTVAGDGENARALSGIQTRDLDLDRQGRSVAPSVLRFDGHRLICREIIEEVA